MSDARLPVFDPGGKYLYFTASIDSGASLQPDIHSIFRDVASTIYLAVLDKEEPTPFLPQSDEEKAEGRSKRESGEPEKKEEEKGKKADIQAPDKSQKDKKPDKDVTVKIDLEGILQRILAVPMPPHNCIDLQTGESGVLLAVDGREIHGTDSVYKYFEAKTGKQVVLTVGPEPKMEGSREVTVVPIASETALRNFAWIEDNRRFADRVTKGKVA